MRARWCGGATVAPGGVTAAPPVAALVELDGSVRLTFSDEEYAELLAAKSEATPAFLKGITAHFQTTVPSATVTITGTDPPDFFDSSQSGRRLRQSARRLASDVRIDFVVS